MPTGTETVISRAVIDVLLLRRELGKHDLTIQERHDLMVSAMPALIALETARPMPPFGLPDPYPERRSPDYCWRSWPPRHTDKCGCEQAGTV